MLKPSQLFRSSGEPTSLWFGITAYGPAVRSTSLRRAIPFVLVAVMLAGCSSGSSFGNTVGGWFGSDSKADGGTFYASAQGLNVHEEPTANSKKVGRLAPNEKVQRTKLTGGYAYVEARGGKLKGWVHNASLNWRTPSKASAPTPKPAPAADDTAADSGEAVTNGASEEGAVGVDSATQAAVDQEASTPAPEAAQPAAAAEATSPAKPARNRKVGASVFDPY